MGDRRDYDRDRDRDRGRDRDDRGYSGKGDKGGKGKGKDGKDDKRPPTRAWATRKMEVQTLSHFMCFKCGETKDRSNFSNSQLLTGRQQCTQCSTLKVAQNLADQMAFSAAARQSRIEQNDPTKPRTKDPVDAAKEELDKNGKTGILCECGALVNSRQQLIQHQRGQKCTRARPEGDIMRISNPSSARRLLAIGNEAAGNPGGSAGPAVPARPKKPDQPAHPKSIIAKRLMRDGAKLWEWNKMIIVEPAATQIAGAGTLKPVFSFKARLTAHENSWVQGDFETTKKAAERSALQKLALWIQEQPESLSTTGRQSLSNWIAPRSVKVVIIPAYRKSATSAWTCPGCGTYNQAHEMACTNCGMDRPTEAAAVDATQDTNFAKICAVLGGSADWAYPGSEAEADWEGSWMAITIHTDQSEAASGTVRVQWEDQSLSDMPPNLIRPKQAPNLS